MVKDIVDVITIIIVLLPIGVQVFGLLSQKLHNQRMINLSERATKIVEALEQQKNLTNEEKKTRAFEKLAAYSKEVGIPVTGDQLDDYIEFAVRLMKAFAKSH